VRVPIQFEDDANVPAAHSIISIGFSGLRHLRRKATSPLLRKCQIRINNATIGIAGLTRHALTHRIVRAAHGLAARARAPAATVKQAVPIDPGLLSKHRGLHVDRCNKQRARRE